MQSSRLNGRGIDQLRQIKLQQGILVQADGSARFTLGTCCALAAVYGPAESLARDELVEKVEVKWKEAAFFLFSWLNSLSRLRSKWCSITTIENVKVRSEQKLCCFVILKKKKTKRNPSSYCRCCLS
jgi:hypothetical protein